MGATVLLIIDMQMGMSRRTREGRARANPGAEGAAMGLVGHFRENGWPVIHVFHDDPHPESPFRKGEPDGAPIAGLEPRADEAVFWKSGSSAFTGTGLEAHLRQNGIDRLVLIGAVAAFCVTSTCRMASDLGFQVILPGDALIGFDLPAHDGGRIDADTVLRVTLSILGADFAQLTTSAGVAALMEQS
jgi:nicotinamidase-related amidase